MRPQIKDQKLYNRYLEIKNSNTNSKKCICVECVLLFFEKLDTAPKLDSAPKHISEFIFLDK